VFKWASFVPVRIK